MSDILMNDKFIAIPLNVGAAIGSYDEAMMLQLVHRWCLYAEKEGSKHNYQEGHYWTYMTYEEVNEQLPMFKMTKVKKLIKDLREKELLIVDSFNRAGFDRTNWYRVNYEKLEVLMSEGNPHWSENDQCMSRKTTNLYLRVLLRDLLRVKDTPFRKTEVFSSCTRIFTRNANKNSIQPLPKIN